MRHEKYGVCFSWPWLLHERGVSSLFYLTTVLENANFSYFKPKFSVSMYASVCADVCLGWNRCESNGELPYTIFIHSCDAVFRYTRVKCHHILFYTVHCVWVCVFKIRKTTLENLRHAFDSGKGHLTFIILDNLKSKFTDEYSAFNILLV